MSRKIKKYYIPSGKKQIDRIVTMMNLLGLSSGEAIITQAIKESINEKLTLADTFESFFRKYIYLKEDSRISAWKKRTRLPFLKTLEQFDFSFPKEVDEKLVRELFTCNDFAQGKNVVFFGPPGVGKTHLSISLAFEATKKGYEVKFVTLEEVIKDVEKVYDNGIKTLKLLRSFLIPDIVIFDDIDYNRTNEQSSYFLFDIVKKRHEAGKSLVFTSNNNFSQWENLFLTKSRAAAALDRIRGNAIVVMINGDSYRMEDKKVKKL